MKPPDFFEIRRLLIILERSWEKQSMNNRRLIFLSFSAPSEHGISFPHRDWSERWSLGQW